MKARTVLLMSGLLWSCISLSQQTVNHNVDFSSGSQYMWGPTGSNFNLNLNVNLFEVEENVNEDIGPMEDVSGFGDFGFEVEADLDFELEGDLEMSGFNNGSVSVNYPIRVTLDMPINNTYDQGDWVTIETSHTVRSGAAINSSFPTTGQFLLELPYDIDAELDAEICAIFCSDIELADINIDGTIELINANQGGVDLIEIGSVGPAYSYSGLPFNITNLSSSEEAYLNGLGLNELFFDLPNVNIGSTSVSGNNLSACGSDQYFETEVSILDLLSNFLPEPAASALANLDGSESVSDPISGGSWASADWSLITALFEAEREANQCLEFTPDVKAQFTFPVAVEYREVNPSNIVVASGNSNVIGVTVGNDLEYKFPCYYEEMDIAVTYSINGQFNNHTYDEMPMGLELTMLELELDLPRIVLIPEVVIPPVCIDVPYDCGTLSEPETCWQEECTDEIIVTPELSFNLPDVDFGPEVQDNINLGTVTNDWIDQTWQLGGFNTHTRPDFTMAASPIVISNTSNDVSCFGAGDGSINVSISAVSHATPYSYDWSHGATNQDPNGLDGGSYTLMAQDANGCDLFTGATILEPSEIIPVFTKVDKACSGGIDDGSIDVTVSGGEAPYTYSWSNGATTEDLTGLSAGTYTLTVTDNRNCTNVNSVTIDEPNALGHNAAITPVNCLGGTDGAIDITPFGGTLPYSYSWSSGGVTEDISDMTAGSYTLTLTDGKGCIDVQTHVIAEPPTAVSVTTTATEVSCFGGNDGTVDVTTSGGTPGYSFSWVSDVGGFLPFTTEDIASIPSGTYTVIATDNNGCQTQLNQFVGEPTAPLSSTPIVTDVLCFGDATGSIDPGISGGTSPYTYTWSTGATTAILSNVPSGNYSLTVTDDRACQDVYNYTITEPNAPLSLTLLGTDILCNGDATGSVETIVDGGTTPYNYAWSNGGTTYTISGLTANTYSLTVTDDHGCTISGSQLLTEPLAPLNATSIITDVDCFGNNNGIIDVTTTGGTLPYVYQWSNSGTLILADTTEDISGQFADDYILEIVDGNGCTFELASTITQPTAPIALSGTVDHANCFGLNDGAIDITVTGGTLTYSYNWSSGQTTEDISNILSGNYTVVVTDANNCQNSMDFFVDQPIAPLFIETIVTDVLCNGGNTGTIDATVTGGTLPYDYDWSNGATGEDLIDLAANVYTLTITDAQGCIAFSGSTVDEPDTLVVTPTITDASCYNYSDGEIQITISGGVQPYYFNWGNQNEILLNNPSESITGLIAEDYFIRVRDENGCFHEQFVTVGQPTPFTANYVITDPLCYEGVDGNVDVTIAGGTQPYTSLWSDGQTTEDAVNLGAGTYDFEVTDDQGCKIWESLEVGQPSPIEISSQIDPVSCIDQSDAAIYVTPYGGTMPYTYFWSTGSTEQNEQGLPPSTYEITITDDHLCTETFSFEIAANFDECLFIPTAFTPNGDNYNDTWEIVNLDLYPNATVKVFNQWGNLLFSSEGTYSPWDGTHNDKPLPAEVYYFIVILNNSESNEYTGTITIVR